MEDLWFNDRSEFTRWVAKAGLLRESFVVVDVGVQGGAHPRWKLLGDYLIFHGFDAIAEAVAEVQQANAGRANYHFHNFALGDEDGERTFYVNVLNPTSSSIFVQGPSRFANERSDEARVVQLRRLDTLFEDGLLPRADFLKVDVEGYEKFVFSGAKNLLSSALGVEAESNFNISPIYPKSHFTALSDSFVEQGLILADIGFNRVPRTTFLQALQVAGLADRGMDELGRPATVNLLFCRDPIDEADRPQNYASQPRSLNVDQIIKTMMIYELFGLNDIALDIGERFSQTLGSRIDVSQAMHLLAKADCRRVTASPAVFVQTAADVPTLRQEVSALREQLSDALRRMIMAEQEMDAIRRSNSWRLTAPLRKAKELARQARARVRAVRGNEKR